MMHPACLLLFISFASPMIMMVCTVQCSAVQCSTCFNVLTLNLQLEILWLLLFPARKANERKYNSFHVQDRVPVG